MNFGSRYQHPVTPYLIGSVYCLHRRTLKRTVLILFIDRELRCIFPEVVDDSSLQKSRSTVRWCSTPALGAPFFHCGSVTPALPNMQRILNKKNVDACLGRGPRRFIETADMVLSISG